MKLQKIAVGTDFNRIELSCGGKTSRRMFRFRIGQKVSLSHHETGIVIGGCCDVVHGRHYVTYVVLADCGLAVRLCEENLRPWTE